VHVAFGAADTLQISIVDDGCGFDLEQGSRKMKHWGLSSMRDTARDIGAEFKIVTAPGEGTRIEVSVRSNSQSKLS
jgi:signal transduction histidine kinase